MGRVWNQFFLHKNTPFDIFKKLYQKTTYSWSDKLSPDDATLSPFNALMLNAIETDKMAPQKVLKSSPNDF